MKKNSKKRVLLSSVAMLMVGAVSLGTATYAWFTQDTRSYADQINVKTSKVSTLLLSKSDRSDWQSHIEYNKTGTMIPASSADGKTWVYGSASDAIKGTIDKTTLKEATGDSKGTYVFEEELNIKNAGAADVENVKITFDLSGENSDYARVALVPIGVSGSAITTDGTFGSATVYGKDANESYQPIKNVAGDLGTAIVPQTTYEVEVPDLAAGKAVYYKLFVWFEGQDKHCIDANSGQGIPNLVFDVDGDTVEDTQG